VGGSVVSNADVRAFALDFGAACWKHVALFFRRRWIDVMAIELGFAMIDVLNDVNIINHIRAVWG